VLEIKVIVQENNGMAHGVGIVNCLSFMENQDEGFYEEVINDMLSKMKERLIAKEYLGVLPILFSIK